MPRKGTSKNSNSVIKSLFRSSDKPPVRHNQHSQNLNRPRKQGDADKPRPKKKRQQRKHVVVAKLLPEKKTAAAHKRAFRLDLPTTMPHTDEGVPWLAASFGDESTKKSPVSRKNQTKIHPPQKHEPKGFFELFGQLASTSRVKLDEEILALARYVQLSPREYDARNAWLDQLTTLVQNTFGNNHENPHLQVYGSFATPRVCTFGSDIDTALWGVVPSSATSPLAAATTTTTVTTIAREVSRKRPAEAVKDDHGSPSKKQARVTAKEPVSKKEKYQKWLAALDSVPLAEEATSTLQSDDTNQPEEGEIDEKVAGLDNCERSESPTVAMFVMGETVVQYDLTDSSTASSTASASDGIEATEDGLNRLHGRARNVTETDCDNSSSSDDDCADKLANFAAVKRLETHASLPSIRHGGRGRKAIIDSDVDDSEEDDTNKPISLSCSDSESETDDECEHRDMRVSFVAHGHRSPVSQLSEPCRMSRDTKDACVAALAKLANRLRKAPQTRRVELIKKARVPIIKMESNLGFEADVAIGGHNGTDTSAYAADQVSRYTSFAPVTLLLKTILSQQKLDTPFHGGLGSYKLYVLVAYHIERHLSLGGRDSPGEIFLSFLYRYGTINPGSATHTRLSQYYPLRTGNAEADLSNVFLLDSCVELFAACWMRLHTRLFQNRDDASRRGNSKKQKNTGSVPKCSSALAVVIDCYTLSLAREDYSRTTRHAA